MFLTAAGFTRVFVGQILGSATVGQVIGTTSPGVAGWVTPATSNVPSFSDAETPSGTVNGTNATFVLSHVDVATGASLILTRNGIVQQAGGNDYTLTSSTVTFVSGSIPQTGDVLLAWYRY